MGPKPSGAKNRITTAAVEDINTTPIMEEQQMLHDLFEYWEGPLIESRPVVKPLAKTMR